MSGISFNTGSWTEEEHAGFVRGLEACGYGNWDAINIFVPTRSSIQIQAYALQLFSAGTGQSLQEVVRHLYGATSSPPSTTSISHIPASNGTDGGDDDGHRGGNGGGGFRSDSRDTSPIPFFADRLVTPQEGEDRDCVRSINSNNDEILLFLAMDDDLGIL